MTTSPTVGVAAGVPFLAVAPVTARPDAPVVLAWHLQDPPRTEAAFAAALPLNGLDAWRIYLGLPMSGSRAPAGGLAEFMRLGSQDAVLNIYGPVFDQAVAEAPAALVELRERFQLGHGPLGVLGGSMGAAVAAAVAAEGALDVTAAVLISPLIRLRPLVTTLGRRYGIDYPWSPPSEAVAARIDLVARAGDLAGRGQPPVLLIVGGDDDVEAVQTPAAQLRDALAARYADPERAALVTVPGMPHALAEEPGIETPSTGCVDTWSEVGLRRHLGLRSAGRRVHREGRRR